MSKIEYSAIEKEMANFNFDELETHTEKARAMMLSKAASATDVKTQICNVWGKIKKYVKYAYEIPIIGKFIRVLGDLLDTICNE